MIKYLKNSLLIPFFLLMTLQMTAQEKQYFLYIQSERNTPFYVRFDGKVLSSSDKGYLIISKLPAGTANMRIGFASGDVPEQQYLVKVGGANDQGYLLKKDGLYNIISFATIRPVKKGDLDAVDPTSKLTGTPPEPVVAAAATPAPAPAPAPVEEPKKAMMDSMQKDLTAAFPANNEGGVTVSPGTRPVKSGNKFSSALDKVVKDDRPEEPLVDPNAGTGMILAPAADTTAVQPEEKKGRKRRRDREPLTAEEQQILADVMAEEHKAAATEPAPAPAPAVAAAAPVEEAPAPVVEEAPAKKSKKSKNRQSDDPSFIDFQDDSSKVAATASAPVVETVPVPYEEKKSKKKKRKADTEEVSGETAPAPAPVAEEPVSTKKKKRKIDTSENPNNVITDPTGYAVTDLNIDNGRDSKKDRKKKKDEEVAAESTVAAEPKKESALKMVNSDCGKVMDDETFRKLLRKFVGGKDDDAMIDAFKKQTKGYCLETKQVKTLVQLLSADESRYHLLDQAYPKVYDSDHFTSLESTLSDSYYKTRFRAMVRK